MFCENCGAEKYSKGSVFCTKCGYQFSKRANEELFDDYQFNFDISIISGLGAGVITGVFSATITTAFNFSPLTAVILYGIIGIFIVYLLVTRARSVKNIVKRRLKIVK
ncbi:MAG: hypothetical protein Q7J03_02885 [Methanoregula sp.]|nr:hypothetical protein [Methanoregula sp.]